MKPSRPLLALLSLPIWFATAPVEQVPAQPAQAPLRPSRLEAGWDMEAAVHYLDDRMDLWFQKAKKLRTGEEKTSCVSCHTAVPYALARPLLRRAMGESKPTAQEQRLLDETVSRVGTYDSHEPLYNSKDEQSRGTEAVLNLLVLAAENAGQNCRVPSEPFRQAFDELWKQQRPDGAWEWLDFGNEPYESSDSVFFGAALAALAIESVPGNIGATDEKVLGHISKLRNYLTGKYSAQNLYNKVWMLLASTRLKGLLTSAQREVLITDLQRHQNADGGWSLYSLGPWTWSKTGPPFSPAGKPDVSLLSGSDGYATGLIAYALRQAGWGVDNPVLKRSTGWLKANQHQCQIDEHSWNCWRTYSLNYDREHGENEGEPWRRMFMSDAATAFAALALLPSD